MRVGFTAATRARTATALVGIGWWLLDLQGRLSVLMRGARAALSDGGWRLGGCGHLGLLPILLISLVRSVLLGVGGLTLLIGILFALGMRSCVWFGIGSWSLWAAIAWGTGGILLMTLSFDCSRSTHVPKPTRLLKTTRMIAVPSGDGLSSWGFRP
jgi:hypothetical protein